MSPDSPPLPFDELDQDDPGVVEKFDVAALGQLLKERRGKLSLRQAAAEAGVSFSTFSRVEAGAQPDLATFTQLCAWLGVSASRFFTPVVERQVSPLDLAITHLNADPRLAGDDAAKIASMMRDMYDALARTETPTRPLVACHLRAAAVMRPGVPDRLAAILTDMDAELRRQVEAGEL
jgi:transcriptional regulator with XRE-family HTH domain